MYSVLRRVYQKILYEAAVKEGVNVRFGCRVKSVDIDAPAVTLDSGEVVKGAVLIGADGTESKLKNSCFGRTLTHTMKASSQEFEEQCLVPTTYSQFQSLWEFHAAV
jgi:2-polyprenyl-6-methoxyphenol hydroxylase-like FAD-dependent oxidoreductase